MQVMLLAAGRGARLRPLTDKTPKPLIIVGGQPLIMHHVQNLATAGFDDIVINHSYLGGQIAQTLGDGGDYGVRIRYSPESSPQEVGGGIRLALSRRLLHNGERFAVVNADIFCNYDFSNLRRAPPAWAHLVLVDNPPRHPSGDFSLDGDGCLQRCREKNRLTYSGIGVYHPDLFAADGRKLLPFLLVAIAQKRAGGEYHGGIWHDAGDKTSLAAARLCANKIR